MKQAVVSGSVHHMEAPSHDCCCGWPRVRQLKVMHYTSDPSFQAKNWKEKIVIITTLIHLWHSWTPFRFGMNFLSSYYQLFSRDVVAKWTKKHEFLKKRCKKAHGKQQKSSNKEIFRPKMFWGQFFILPIILNFCLYVTVNISVAKQGYQTSN